MRNTYSRLLAITFVAALAFPACGDDGSDDDDDYLSASDPAVETERTESEKLQGDASSQIESEDMGDFRFPGGPRPPREEPISCGGLTGGTCPFLMTCVDIPDDGCDPDNGGADCPGMCVFAGERNSGGRTGGGMIETE